MYVFLVAAEKKTCKDDYTCPDGYLNLGDKECSGKCDRRECCEKGALTTSLSRHDL